MTELRTRSKSCSCFCRLAFFCLALVLLACSEERPAVDFIQDRAGLLAAEQRQRLEAFQRLLLLERDVHLFVATLGQPAEDLDRTAIQLFEQQALGSQTNAARGLLLVIDPHNRQARIEVGYDLEGVFPDGFIAGLEYDQMLPFFQQQRIGHGIEALTELLVARLANADEAEPPAREIAAKSHLSGGAGARIDLTHPLADEDILPDADHYRPGTAPLETLQRYRDSLARRIKNPELGIYTPDSRQFFRQWLVTDAQQQNALRILETAMPTAEVLLKNDLAVIRFPVDNRQASPYFLRLVPQGWQLDFVSMSQTIGFNHRNQWHFRSREHHFMFAFNDWSFDTNGFPHSSRD